MSKNVIGKIIKEVVDEVTNAIIVEKEKAVAHKILLSDIKRFLKQRCLYHKIIDNVIYIFEDKNEEDVAKSILHIYWDNGYFYIADVCPSSKEPIGCKEIKFNRFSSTTAFLYTQLETYLGKKGLKDVRRKN